MEGIATIYLTARPRMPTVAALMQHPFPFKLMNDKTQTAGRPGFALAALALAAALTGTGCQSAKQAAAPPAPTRAQQTAMTPQEALERLKAGNARYVSGHTLHRDWATQRGETAGGQYPYAVILRCLDSRTSSEILFDVGHGEVFNARVAGNVLDTDILGSMEFACKAAGAKLIAVVGHTECGAIMGACSGVQLGNLTGLLQKIEPAVLSTTGARTVDIAADPGVVDRVARENVKLVMRQIVERSPLLRDMIGSGEVGLVGGMYDLESGQVTFWGN